MERQNSLINGPPLPEPSEDSAADVVIYDGNCRFCTRQAQRLAAWDGRDRLAFLSLHDPLAADRYPDLPRDLLMEQMVVVDRRGRRHIGAQAVRYLARRLPRLWPLVPILHLPFTLPLWSWLYRRIARFRYRLAGRVCDEGTCSTHLR